MRILPVALIVLFVVLIGSSLGAGILWVVCGVSLVGLGVLIFFMFRAGQFVGPRVLMDDPGVAEEPTPDVVLIPNPDKDPR